MRHMPWYPGSEQSCHVPSRTTRLAGGALNDVRSVAHRFDAVVDPRGQRRIGAWLQDHAIALEAGLRANLPCAVVHDDAGDLVLEIHTDEVIGRLLQRQLRTLEVLVLEHGDLGGVHEGGAQQGGKCEPNEHIRSSEKRGNKRGVRIRPAGSSTVLSECAAIACLRGPTGVAQPQERMKSPESVARRVAPSPCRYFTAPVSGSPNFCARP